jgi:hypothetical protein
MFICQLEGTHLLILPDRSVSIDSQILDGRRESRKLRLSEDDVRDFFSLYEH